MCVYCVMCTLHTYHVSEGSSIPRYTYAVSVCSYDGYHWICSPLPDGHGKHTAGMSIPEI